jgi:hypothetical protein
LSTGPQRFVLDYRALGERNGVGTIVLNDQVVIEAAELMPTPVRLPSGGLDVGINRRQPISERIAGRNGFRYSGVIDVVRIEPGLPAPNSPLVQDEAAVQARMRAGASAAAQ